MDTNIRSAEPSDLDALIELSLRTTRASYSSILGKETVEAFIGAGYLEGFVRESIGRALVLTLEGKIAGYGVGTDAHIDQLMIDEHFHRQGLGSLLLERLEDHLFSQHDSLELESFRDNDQANAFYRKHGWQAGEPYRDEQQGVDMVTMRKAAR